jgi:hypothetical protein
MDAHQPPSAQRPISEILLSISGSDPGMEDRNISATDNETDNSSGTKMTEMIVVHNDDPHRRLIPALERHLPYSIPLLRSTQYAVAHAGVMSQTYFLATANLPSQGSDVDAPWLAAYVNLFRGRETQVWIYSSLEAETGPGSAEDHHDAKADHVASFSRISSEKKELARAQFVSLLVFIKQRILPEYLAFVASVNDEHLPSEAVVETDAVPKIPKHPPQAILIGTLHTGVLSLLSTSTAIDPYVNMTPVPGVKVHRYDLPPYVKYLFHPSIFQRETVEHHLPPGYRYADRKGRRGLLPHQADLVISRTMIPRARESLLSMSSVVIYSEEETQGGADEIPIAWGFLGPDGSLLTLHVEPAHRGQGLAVNLSKEVMRTAMTASTEDGRRIYGSAGDGRDDANAYTHTDVAMTNTASRRVMEKIGGKLAWTVTWTVVEVVGDV